MWSTEAFGAELVDLLPELAPASDRVGQCPEAEHDLGPCGFPAHTGGAQPLLDGENGDGAAWQGRVF
jgi:hypothetical protein